MSSLQKFVGMVNSAELALKAQYSIIDLFIGKILKITKVLHSISHNLNYSELILTILLYYSIFDIPFLKVTFYLYYMKWTYHRSL